jgi:tetratricopeptide (TPR) repeat protein
MSDEGHESLEGWRRLLAGETSPAEAEQAAAHLAGCRACWLLAARARSGARFREPLAVPGPLRSLLDLQAFEQGRAREYLEAQAAWAEIRWLGAKARRDKVRLTRTLHNLGFREVLLEEGRGAATPAESEELFYLALLVSQQLPSPRFSAEYQNDLCAECCAEIANARRRLAKWPAAREILKKGLDQAARGSRNGVAEGKILCVEGALEADLGQGAEARQQLKRAADLFEAAGQTLLKSQTLLQLAYTLVDVDPSEGLRVIEQALAVLPADQARLRLLAENLKIDCLLTLGVPEEALLRFKALQGQHEQFQEPFLQLRRRFTVARLLEHLGRFQKAEILFQEVLAGDLEHGLLKDFFLDLVYLFGFQIRRGKLAEAIAVCQRAGQELSLLEEEEGSGPAAREQMRRVWRNLEDAARRGAVELGATRILRNYIVSHWRIPAEEPPCFKSSK